MISLRSSGHTGDVLTAARYVQSLVSNRPKAALILGSGLGGFAESLRIRKSINVSDIPHYPKPTVVGHKGRILFCDHPTTRGRTHSLVVFQGRLHFYESNSVSQTLFPVNLAHALGADYLIATNAAGAVSRGLRPGDLMLVDDVMSFTFIPPFLPLNRDSHDLKADRARRIGRDSQTAISDVQLKRIALNIAQERDLQLAVGTYCWLKGPTYETAAEIEMLSRAGVDAVGMSTVPELARGKELGMHMLALSLVSNMGTGIAKGRLSHAEVTRAAKRARKAFSGLLMGILGRISD